MRATRFSIGFLLIAIVSAVPHQRMKRQAYNLPSGSELLVAGYSTNFVCQENGYFADVDNNCQIFHVCNNAGSYFRQYSFVCGNQTIFSQLSLTCVNPDEAIPCGASTSFNYLNSRIGVQDTVFLDENDVNQANELQTKSAFPRPPSRSHGGFSASSVG